MNLSRFNALVLSCATTVAFVGCGGGSDSTAPITSTTLSGVAVDDLIGNGIVTIIRPDTNATLISGRTKTDGTYSLALPVGFTGPVLVTISADATTTGMPVGMVLRSVDVVNTGETTHSTPVSFLSEMAAAMALSSTGDIKTAIKTARQQLEIGAMTGGVPVDLSANPATDTIVKALVDTIRVSAGDGDARTAFIAALSNDLKDGSASSTQFTKILTDIGTNAALDALDDDTVIANTVTAITNGTAYTPAPPPVVADGVAAGITSSKTMFRELRTQALALTDYQNSGTPGFFDKKALEVEAATRDVVGPDSQAIGYMIDAMDALDKDVMTSAAVGTSIDVITATKVAPTDSYNFMDSYGSNYNVTTIADQNYYSPFWSLSWMNDIPHSLTVIKTGVNSYSYIFTDANDTSKTYTGTFSWNGTVLSMNGSVPTTNWVNTPSAMFGWTGVQTKMTANITGALTTSGTTDSISYAGTLKTYTGTTLDTTITVNSAHYKLINVAAIGTTPPKTIAEPLDFDGKFEMKSYTLAGKITASDYVDTDDHGKIIHAPRAVSFEGKASDSTDGSYISGSVTGSATSAALLTNWLYNVSFTGELNVPNRPLTKVILGYVDVNANKANVSLTYSYDTTKITGTGVVAKHSTTVDGTNEYTAEFKNLAGVTINVLGNIDGTVSGSVSKDGMAIGTIDMLRSVPRVKYSDGTFETFL